ncbi:MAG: pseudouridine synthase [Lentisphaeraceae bacterium]|nr:pseudouridine synthase [Lentisphaeraceae bacterium]
MGPLPVLFEDENYLVIDKPPELLVHRSSISRDKISVVQILKEQLDVDYIHPIHRIDRATSGVLFLSKNTEATKSATELFMNHKIQKTYFAILRGWPAEESGTIDKALKNDKGVVQEAISHYKLIHQVELPVQINKFPTTRYSLVRFQPKTGRQHQIRRHAKHLTGPIIGDTKFGKKDHNTYFSENLNSKNLLLFAAQLKLELYPEQEVTFKAPLAASFVNICEKFSWDMDEILKNY